MACLTWEAGPPLWPGSASVLQAGLHTKFPVIFPVMCSLILDQRPLDSRVMGSQIKKFSLLYYLLLYLTSALEVGTIPRDCQKFQLLSSIFQYISGKENPESALPSHFFPSAPSLSLSISFSPVSFSKRSSLTTQIKKEFFLLFF